MIENNNLNDPERPFGNRTYQYPISAMHDGSMLGMLRNKISPEGF